ncbi:MAG: tryptophan--tRNA ligase [Solirubrobacterales bacterium]|nr:tryptophan--tRNA ligase [Solirubrobacterales bacterium]MCO5325603.1 tryptophan--tRNA ligase [Solirubrobacterales bacterium]
MSATTERIFSGIQPTGRKHLGNYIGAIRQYVAGQETAAAPGDAIFCIVDLHATTVDYDPAKLRERVHDTVAILLAAGLDPERCVLFRQGDVREHAELSWLLSGVTAWGDLNRMHQWKVKREQIEAGTGGFVSAGLFSYPVLMAADVLAYRANVVPVGDDQRQHIELMREVARRFNERFGPPDVLVVPEGRIPEVGARIMDLQDPFSKMSTTSGGDAGRVYVLDEPDAIRKKFRSAVTDSGREVRRGSGKEGIANLIDVLAVVGGRTPESIEAEFEGAGYGDFKMAVGDAVAEYLAPVRERYAGLREDEAELERALAAGAGAAREICAPVLADVREAMGVAEPR